MKIIPGPLGRTPSPDQNHIAKYPFTVAETVEVVEVDLPLPEWHEEHDQGSEGACVGFGWRMAKAILDFVRGNPWWIWNEAKKIDIWPDTNPGDNNGTSVRAGGDVLRDKGMPLEGSEKPDPQYKIKENRWARNIDEMRTAISKKIPVVIGVNWYLNFDRPKKKDGEYWIGLSNNLGTIRGGHCVCIFRASDKRQAFGIKNSWGSNYPIVWIPYTVMQRLLNEGGEAALITDGIDVPVFTFTRQLKIGSKNNDVLQLQKWLNAHGYVIADTGAGSIGNETNYFGTLTKKQVERLQTDKGIAKKGEAGFGQVGPKTREYLNSNQ